MTYKEFKQATLGSIVITNKRCRNNAGIKCKIIYKHDDGCFWITPLPGERRFDNFTGWTDGDWNEVSYCSVNNV